MLFDMHNVVIHLIVDVNSLNIFQCLKNYHMSYPKIYGADVLWKKLIIFRQIYIVFKIMILQMVFYVIFKRDSIKKNKTIRIPGHEIHWKTCTLLLLPTCTLVWLGRRMKIKFILRHTFEIRLTKINDLLFYS